jgi:hypothetical protein
VRFLHEAGVHLVQLLLPFGRRREMYERVFRELTERFGGMTAYSRSPAEGLWKKRRDAAERDDIVVVEVMVERLDRRWWARYRATLERRFRQREVVVRAHAIEAL